jgi:hypothetical protein
MIDKLSKDERTGIRTQLERQVQWRDPQPDYDMVKEQY